MVPRLIDLTMHKKDGPGMKGLNTLILSWFALYLILGNLPRVGANIFLLGGLPITELILYVLVLFGYLVHIPLLRIPKFFAYMLLLFPLSWSIGALSNINQSYGNHTVALLYALRMVALLLTANFIGRILSQRGMSPDCIVKFFFRIFLVQIIIASFIYIIFPSAASLWAFLAHYGFYFYGDPHLKRLLGPLLDPNYFGNILVLAAILAASRMLLKRRFTLDYLYFLIFVIAIVFTVSRSSFLGFTVSMIVLLLSRVTWSKFSRLIRFSAILIGSVLIVLLLSSWFNLDVLSRFYQRFDFQDSSATSRLFRLIGAVGYLLSFPYILIGTGYNYIPFVVEKQYIVASFDQSLINLFVAFGIPLGILVSSLFWAWIHVSLKAIKRMDRSLHIGLVAYLFAAVIMSFLNNLLFYTPFLLTVLPILSYGYWQRINLNICTIKDKLRLRVGVITL